MRDEPYGASVSDEPPRRTAVVAPERAVATGRYGAERTHDDKSHHDAARDGSRGPALHAAPAKPRWVLTRAGAAVTAGALLLVAVIAVGAAALTRGGATPPETGSAASSTVVSSAAASSTTAATATPTPTASPAPSPTAIPVPSAVTLTVTGALQRLDTEGFVPCFFVSQDGFTYELVDGDTINAHHIQTTRFGAPRTMPKKTGIYLRGDFTTQDADFQVGDPVSVTGVYDPLRPPFACGSKAERALSMDQVVAG